jgi:hypothetical protein
LACCVHLALTMLGLLSPHTSAIVTFRLHAWPTVSTYLEEVCPVRARRPQNEPLS